MNLAVRDIRYNLGRFALTTVGVGLLLMVVMGLGGIYRGIIEDATLLVQRIGADIWVVQGHTRGPFAELSRVPADLVDRARAVPGVADAREFVFHTIQREHAGTPLRTAVVGLSWPGDKGEWLPLIGGRPLAQAHYEMIADRTLGLALGDRVRFGKDTYTIVGITKNMISSAGDGLAFFTVADAQAIQFDLPAEAVRIEQAARRGRGVRGEVARQQPALLDHAAAPPSEIPALGPPQVTAVMIRVAPGAEPAKVAATIAGWPDVSVYSRAEQEALLVEGTVDKARRQIGQFRVLLTIIAAIIMALILYTLTLDKVHAIALLKLIGAPNRVILGLILRQALVLGVLGYVIAYLLGQKVFPRFPRRVILTETDLAQLAVIVLAISIGASVLGIWKAMRVSPQEALS